MPSQLPDFADAWIQQWKDAAPRLQAIRDEELRRRGDGSRTVGRGAVSGVVLFDRYPERHGMVQMQRWFMRRQLVETANQMRTNSNG